MLVVMWTGRSGHFDRKPAYSEDKIWSVKGKKHHGEMHSISCNSLTCTTAAHNQAAQKSSSLQTRPQQRADAAVRWLKPFAEYPGLPILHLVISAARQWEEPALTA